MRLALRSDESHKNSQIGEQGAVADKAKRNGRLLFPPRASAYGC